ncbi:maleylpyruvate isomerase N-terminal domain-containing protein [Actinokineospora bangkokensis]|uniref:Uncharacterized protein n=1 Tax=Actinokineospora bangkokensis TaxID=1193682 RepID=A0A1Q9LHJ9_9PSEU|nr:maleylpyruvate isomerase N-terminal domain-containing protein [Actinokineospora bangkokensis]OLR91496.1 hypothetical protein BJP25_26410 [Actinokineospora bangkokensis]
MPLTADDVDTATWWLVDTLSPATDRDWTARAGELTFTCWETAEHLTDDLLSYATRVALRRHPTARTPPFAWAKRHPEGPMTLAPADPAAGPPGLLQVIEAYGACLSAALRTAPPTHRAWHVYGESDPEGFAAMATVELLVHGWDITQGLSLPWNPPPGLSTQALHRLFPHAPTTTDPDTTLLWATGRTALPTHPRLTEWRWYSEPHPNTAGEPPHP